MLEKLKYINHENEVFDFGENGIFARSNELHDYAWNVAKKNNRISDISYAVTTQKLPVVIKCTTEEEGITARNRLLEIAEKDVLAMQYGRVVIGDYYMRCYITKSVKSDYLITKQYMVATLTLTTDLPYWIKETSYIFAQGETEAESSGLDFPFDHPFDYHNGMANKIIKNTGFMPTNFRLIISGACVNPSVYIAGHLYQVNCTVGANQYLTIDSAGKTVTLTSNDGTVTNVFNDRNKESYIFEKVPAGQNAVSWSGNFSFEIVLLEERSEPKWT